MSELKVLEYLKKQGSTNTFRLGRDLGMDRHHLLNLINKLEAKGALIVKSGVVKFIKFPLQERKIPKKQVEKNYPKPKKAKAKKSSHRKIPKRSKIKPNVLQVIQSENKQLKEKLIELEANKRRWTNINKKFREQVEYTKNLEKEIKELQKKINTVPKNIKKKITKKVPRPRKRKYKKKIKKTVIKLPKKRRKDFLAGDIFTGDIQSFIKKIKKTSRNRGRKLFKRLYVK